MDMPKTMTLEQARKLYVQQRELVGETREVIGGYVVSADASKVPWMTDEEFAELQVSIAENGLIDRIELSDQDEIQDGRNRMLACLAQDVEPEFKYAEIDDSAALVEMRNLTRRHLTASMRAQLYLKLHGQADQVPDDEVDVSEDSETEESPEVEEAKPTVVKTPDKPAKSLDEQAANAGVSRRTMADARKVDKSGTEELKNAVIKGDVPASVAAKIADKPPEEQRAAVESRKADPPKKREVSEAMFDVNAWASSMEKRISKILASVPSSMRDTCHRRLGEILGSTVRLERETSDLMTSSNIVEYVEQLVKEMPKGERAGAEQSLAERYGSVITVKESETAITKIETIVEALPNAEKKKAVASLGEKYKLPLGKKAEEYLPELPADDIEKAMKLTIEELKFRSTCLKAMDGFGVEQRTKLSSDIAKVGKSFVPKAD